MSTRKPTRPVAAVGDASVLRHEGLTITVETITPEIAHEWLGFNTHNRNAKAPPVGRYAEDMAAGAWPVAGDPIRFDWSDPPVLLDGQHRLLACIQAEVPFSTVVIRGLDPDVMPMIDQGSKRTLADVLKLRGEVDTINLAATVALCLRWDRGEVTRTVQPPPSACLVWLEANPTIRDDVRDAKAFAHAPLYLAVRSVAAFMYRLREVETERDGEEFLERLLSGAHLGERDAIYVLRRWLSAADERKTLVLAHQQLAMLIKAFNYWDLGVEVNHLRLGAREKFPTLGDSKGAGRRAAAARRRSR